MVHYILRFTITMNHVIYGVYLVQLWGLGERCKLPQAQRGLGRSAEPQRKSNLMHFSLKI